MSDFLNKIKKETTPAIENSREYSSLAKIIGINEANNTCSIYFEDKTGNKINKDNVTVAIPLPGVFCWFPKLNDIVNISIKNNYVQIISLFEGNYATEYRGNYLLKNDTYSSSNVIAGMIF